MIQENQFADIIIFDPNNIHDRATFEEGTRTAIGMDYVFVNGTLVLDRGTRTEALPGMGLRRS